MPKVTANGHVFNFPDGVSNDDIASAVDDYFSNQTTPVAESNAASVPTIDSDVPLVPGMEGYEQQQAAQKKQYADYNAANPEPSMTDKLGAGLKAGGVMLGNLIPSTVGALGGSVYGAAKEIAGAPTGSGAEYMQKGAETFSPFKTDDPLANEYIEKTGNVLGALDPGFIAPRVPNAAGSLSKKIEASPAIQNEAALIPKSIDDLKGVTKGIGDDLRAQSGDLMQGDNLPASSAPRNYDIIEKIKSGSNENALAPYDVEVANPNLKDKRGNLLPQAYKLVDDNEANAAIKQGWEKGTVQAVKNFDKKTTDTAMEMINISKKGSLDDTYRAENRPISAIGEPMAEQLSHIKSVKKSAGKELNRIVNEDLAKETVDITPATSEFIDRLQNDLGVKIKPGVNGLKIDFNGSTLEGSAGNIPGVQNIIKTIANRAYNAKNTSAKGAHDFKNFIDNQVKYGAGIEGLSGQVDNIVKNLRHNIDSTLDTNFPEYDHVNKVYSETKGALDEIQALAGKNVDLEKDYTPQALGKLSRTILSNNKSAERVAEALNNLDDISAAHGGERTGKLKALVKFSTILDKNFGAAADTSFLGDIQSALEPSVKGSSVGVLKAIGKKAIGKNQENAYKSMQDLLIKQKKKAIKTEGSKP